MSRKRKIGAASACHSLTLFVAKCGHIAGKPLDKGKLALELRALTGRFIGRDTIATRARVTSAMLSITSESERELSSSRARLLARLATRSLSNSLLAGGQLKATKVATSRDGQKTYLLAPQQLQGKQPTIGLQAARARL